MMEFKLFKAWDFTLSGNENRKKIAVKQEQIEMENNTSIFGTYKSREKVIDEGNFSTLTTSSCHHISSSHFRKTSNPVSNISAQLIFKL